MKDDHHLNDNTANTALPRILHIKYTTQKNMVVNGQYKILFLPFLSTLPELCLIEDHVKSKAQSGKFLGPSQLWWNKG
jgi:hypothetical protein